AYAEAIRAIRLTVDLNDEPLAPTKIIGLTSSLPHEGKSTIAAGMAALIAQSGARCLLIDGDVRNPTLTRALAPEAKLGLLEAMVGNTSVSDAVWAEPSSRMVFLPTVINSQLGNPIEILTSKPAKAIFQSLRHQYDYVIVDLPPLSSEVDVKLMSRLIDSF